MNAKRLLVVDDEATVRSLLTRQLVLAGFETVVAGNGRAALTAVAAEPFDAIVLDVIMPGLDGFEVCRRLKANPQTAGIPVVFFSTSSSGEFRRRAFNLGAADFLVKPFQTNVLPAYIQAILQRVENPILGPGRVTAVIGGGAAAEAVRLAEAAALNESGPIMLIDLELPTGSIGARLQLAGGPNVRLLLQDTGEPVSPAAIDRVARRFHHALQVLPAPFSPSLIEQAEPLLKRLEAILDILTIRGYHTILHLGTQVDELTLTAMARAEAVWVTTRDENTTEYDTLRVAIMAGGIAGERLFPTGDIPKETRPSLSRPAARIRAHGQGRSESAGQLAALV
jgi:CheY-like chemotaxis protein